MPTNSSEWLGVILGIATVLYILGIGVIGTLVPMIAVAYQEWRLRA